MSKRLQKIFSILCIFTMLFGDLPMNVIAEGISAPAAQQEAPAENTGADMPVVIEQKEDPVPALPQPSKDEVQKESPKEEQPAPTSNEEKQEADPSSEASASNAETAPADDKEPESAPVTPEAPKTEPEGDQEAQTEEAPKTEPESDSEAEPAADVQPEQKEEGEAAAPEQPEQKDAAESSDKVTVPEVPVDHTLNVGGSVNATMGKVGMVTMRLKADKAGVVNIVATGMNIWVDVQNESNGSHSRYAMVDDQLFVRFNASVGTYLLTFGAMRPGQTGSFTVKTYYEENAPKADANAEAEEAPAEEPAAEDNIIEETPVTADEPAVEAGQEAVTEQAGPRSRPGARNRARTGRSARCGARAGSRSRTGARSRARTGRRARGRTRAGPRRRPGARNRARTG